MVFFQFPVLSHSCSCEFLHKFYFLPKSLKVSGTEPLGSQERFSQDPASCRVLLLTELEH